MDVRRLVPHPVPGRGHRHPPARQQLPAHLPMAEIREAHHRARTDAQHLAQHLARLLHRLQGARQHHVVERAVRIVRQDRCRHRHASPASHARPPGSPRHVDLDAARVAALGRNRCSINVPSPQPMSSTRVPGAIISAISRRSTRMFLATKRTGSCVLMQIEPGGKQARSGALPPIGPLGPRQGTSPPDPRHPPHARNQRKGSKGLPLAGVQGAAPPGLASLPPAPITAPRARRSRPGSRPGCGGNPARPAGTRRGPCRTGFRRS